MAAARKSGLGRGLDALFADVSVREDSIFEKDKEEKTDSFDTDAVRYIKIHDIAPNANQPRKTFDQEKIDELAESIEKHGIIQPILVRKRDKGFEIVAGERRWRAAMKANLPQVPCIVRELNDEQNMLFAIIENMQREDLNPVEEAEGLRQMTETFGMTQEQVSKSVGKSRPYITNALRLLKLPDYVKDSLADGTLSAGHARALINVTDEEKRKNIWKQITEKGISVRETEKLAAARTRTKKKDPHRKTKDPNTARAEEELKAALGTRVVINNQGGKGKIEIDYYSKDELERLLELLKSLG